MFSLEMCSLIRYDPDNDKECWLDNKFEEYRILISFLRNQLEWLKVGRTLNDSVESSCTTTSGMNELYLLVPIYNAQLN
jgi:hypothetical protein